VTDYPFDERVKLEISLPEEVRFPLSLRIPGWCTRPEISINGEMTEFTVTGGMAVLDRLWKEGDRVELVLPMEVKLQRWVENSVSVERGPLVYVLKIREEWKKVENGDRWGNFSEVRPLDPWNVGLTESAVADPAMGFRVVYQETKGAADRDLKSGETPYPWCLENAPVALMTTGKEIPDWTLYRGMAGPLPHSLPMTHLQETAPEKIMLIPYGCSTLRITEFPVVR